MISAVPADGEKPILEDLAALGFNEESLADLRHSGFPYGEAVPVLLKWLADVNDPKLKDEIVRALSVPWAKPQATVPLIHEFRRVQSSDDPHGMGLRWTIGNALNVVFDDASFGDLVDIATDRRYGSGRQMVVLGLGKSKNLDAANVLVRLLDDPEVNGHALKALRKLRALIPRRRLEDMLRDQRTWVRNEARKALDALPNDTKSGP